MKKFFVLASLVLMVSVYALAAGNFFSDPASAVDALPKQTLSASEVLGMLQMREEEKLARDVYWTLYQKWGDKIFYNIAQSEKTHMAAVKALLDKYDLQDPVTNNATGAFTNPHIKELYVQLVKEGDKSLVDALKMGARIEELDIYDLDVFLKQTNNEDIKLVYENLKKGSENHLRAFMSQLEKQGATYKPIYISQEQFDSILNATQQKGHGK